MSLNAEQRQAVEARGSVAVIAGAGTGKTHMLAERYLHHLITDSYSPLEIVAVTFTEKAAAELRARIRRLAAERLTGWDDLSAELEAAQISTIHALAMRICQEHPHAAGVPADFSVLDELDGSLLVAEWLHQALDQLPLTAYEQVPFSLLRTCIRTLLKDPVTAERALAQGDEQWSALVEQTRSAALAALLGQDEWCQAAAVISGAKGAQGDRIEEARAQAAAAIAALAGGDVARLDDLCSLDLRGGSKKAWPQGNIDAVKEALKTVREAARAAVNAGLITLSLGDADRTLAALVPVLREAFHSVREHLAREKRRARLLDFADLEAQALRALSHAQVRDYYAQRWRAFLVDEFQDTNPVQAELLELLAGSAKLTIVGDDKQSIYGFRRADVAVFRSFCARIVAAGGSEIRLAQNYRTQAQLMTQINTISQAMMPEIHQDLMAARAAAPGASLSVCVVAADKESNKHQRQLIEARHIAALVRAALDGGIEIRDRATDSPRAVTPGDIAVLARAWEPLKYYGDALEELRIPTTHAGGGSLLETREAKDALALLRFLANTHDNLALVALLRSPFFTVSDRALLAFAQKLPRPAQWWQALSEHSDFAPAVAVLNELIKASREATPSRLLQLADRMCGYSAVIGNLPGAARREADWRGFMELVRDLEWKSGDLFALARRLRRMAAADVEVPRKPLEAGDTVALMTIHGAKGLEWPVVIVPDLTRASMSTQPPIFFDAELGAAVRPDGEESARPALYTLLEQRQRAREEAETRRILYVALTRARERLILSATDESGGALDLLRPGLENAGVVMEIVKFDIEAAVAPAPALPALPAEPAALLL